MYKNEAGQNVLLFAFTKATNEPLNGDAANITATVAIDSGTPAATTTANPTAYATLGDGFYLLPLSQAETNGATIDVAAESATS